MLGQVEGFADFAKGRDRLAATLRGRVDDRDTTRNLLDIQQLYWRRRWRQAEVLIGVDQVFWGATEALHLVDVVNQTDLAASPDGEDKLGQPMVRVTLTPAWGTWDFFVLPAFRERTFPGRRGRLRGPLRINQNESMFEASAGDGNTDFAVRYSHYLGSIDFAVSHFSGTSRLPLFAFADGTVPNVQPQSLAQLPPQLLGAELIPHYFLTDQTGLEGTMVIGGLVWKLEAIRGRDPRGRFSAATGGFEYTVNGIASSNLDLGLIVEYQYDSRPTDLLITTDDDWVIGARLAFNDFAGSEILLLQTRDRRTRAGVTSIEASRRFSNRWRGSLEARLFSDGDGTDALALFAEEDYLQISVTRFF